MHGSYHLYENGVPSQLRWFSWIIFPQVDVKKQKIFAKNHQPNSIILTTFTDLSQHVSHVDVVHNFKVIMAFQPGESMRKKKLQSLRRFAGEKSFPNKAHPFL